MKQVGRQHMAPTERVKSWPPRFFLCRDYSGGYLIYKEGATPTTPPPANFYPASDTFAVGCIVHQNTPKKRTNENSPRGRKLSFFSLYKNDNVQSPALADIVSASMSKFIWYSSIPESEIHEICYCEWRAAMQWLLSAVRHVSGDFIFQQVFWH